jgi:hypothetical protein
MKPVRDARTVAEGGPNPINSILILFKRQQEERLPAKLFDPAGHCDD